MEEDPANPYGLFIDVLSYPRTPGRLAALVGEMISLHAELNQLFGRTKGKIERAAWLDCADQVELFYEHCKSAWVRFSASVDRGLDDDPQAGVGVMDAFQAAVPGTRAVLERMTREYESLGRGRWELRWES